MFLLVTAALVNGVIICLSVVSNARLQAKIGPFKASFINHLLGCALLLVVVFALTPKAALHFGFRIIPIVFYCGGVISAVFVAFYSYVAPRIGILRTVVLIISGQMLTAAALDVTKGLSFAQIAGMLLILIGVAVLYRGEKGTSESASTL